MYYRKGITPLKLIGIEHCSHKWSQHGFWVSIAKCCQWKWGNAYTFHLKRSNDSEVNEYQILSWGCSGKHTSHLGAWNRTVSGCRVQCAWPRSPGWVCEGIHGSIPLWQPTLGIKADYPGRVPVPCSWEVKRKSCMLLQELQNPGWKKESWEFVDKKGKVTNKYHTE